MTKDDVKYAAKRVLPIFILWEGLALLDGWKDHDLASHAPQMASWFIILTCGFFGFLFSHIVKRKGESAGKGVKTVALLRSIVTIIPVYVAFVGASVVEGYLEKTLLKVDSYGLYAGDMLLFGVACIILGAVLWAWFAFVEEE